MNSAGLGLTAAGIIGIVLAISMTTAFETAYQSDLARCDSTQCATYVVDAKQKIDIFNLGMFFIGAGFIMAGVMTQKDAIVEMIRKVRK